MTGDTIDQTPQSDRLAALLALLHDLTWIPSDTLEPPLMPAYESHRVFHLNGQRISVSVYADGLGKRYYLRLTQQGTVEGSLAAATSGQV